ncbi:uncharacterized protein [Amphiura filiformis]|uniref:uncharacterized protein n=1 Tax=Amphiura filiformis TaxID=82378 RepID=UPI003B219F99
MKINTNLKLEDTKTDDFFQDLADFITSLCNMHAQHLPQTTAQDVHKTLNEIRMDAFDIDLCRQELIRKYEDERGKVTLFPFDIDSTVDIDDVFVDLVLLQESTKPTEVEEILLQTYDELFSLKKTKDKDKRVLRVLLKGDAGSGKTTLTEKIAFDWAQGVTSNKASDLRKFDLLFSLKMRDFDQDMSLVDAIFDQLLPSDSKVSRRGLEKYIVQNAEKVAVILDGADEFSGKIEKSPKGNLVMDVVCNKMLCNSCVVVTTRPHKVDTVSVFSQYSHVHVVGFGERSMLEFIGKFFQVKTFKSEEEVHEHVFGKSEFKDKKEEFIHDFKDMESPIEAESPVTEHEEGKFEDSISKTNTVERKKSVDAFITTIFRSRDLLPMSFIPVILTMLCLLWGEAQKLPTRFTTLYQEMFHYFIQRWYEKSDDCTGTEEFEKGILSQLGEVALKCLFERRLHFTAGELNNAVILEQSRSIGIIKEETKRSKLRLVKQYSFFHMSFQEFCAAVYWTSLAGVFDVKFMDYLSRVNSDNVESFEYVLLFCCGLSTVAASHILSHLVDIRSSDVTDGMYCEFDLSLKRTWSLGLRFLFESQCPSLVEVLTKWLQCKEIKITIHSNSYHREFERQASFNYFIDCFEKHVLSAEKRGISHRQLLKGTELQVVQFFSSLQDLALQYAAKDPPYWKYVFRKLRKAKMLLRQLCLMDNSLGGSEVESAMSDFVHILPNMTHLQEINLSSTNLGPRDIELLSPGLVSCSNLKSLNLSNNSVRFKEMHLLSQSLHKLSQLNVLDMSDNPIRDLGVLALCNCFSKQGFQLQHLLLNNCGLSSTGLLMLSLSFRFLSDLSHMEIAQNEDVGSDGVKWVFEYVGCLKNLVKLHLATVRLSVNKSDDRLRRVFRKLKWEPKTNTEHIYNCTRVKQLNVSDLGIIVEEFPV